MLGQLSERELDYYISPFGITPNKPADISSWALDKAKATSSIPFIDNTAREIPCYDMRYTFVEKLQTMVTKFRQEMADGKEHKNYMRQYYDVYCLLKEKAVQEFLGTDEYLKHKDKRLPKIDKSTEILHIPVILTPHSGILTPLQ